LLFLGSDFLGYQITPTTLLPGAKTIEHYRANMIRLYERDGQDKRIEPYQRRWMGWVKGGLGDYLSPGQSSLANLQYGKHKLLITF